MNRAVRGRRLASPVRLALAAELGSALDGAWWPHTASIAAELPELVDALSTRLGEVATISINWSPLECSPDLDAVHRERARDPGRFVGHQRLMTVVGNHGAASRGRPTHHACGTRHSRVSDQRRHRARGLYGKRALRPAPAGRRIPSRRCGRSGRDGLTGIFRAAPDFA